MFTTVGYRSNGVGAIADGKHQEFGKMQNHFWKWLNYTQTVKCISVKTLILLKQFILYV